MMDPPDPLNKHDVEEIAANLIQQKIDRDRQFIVGTFKAVLWFVGASLTVVLGVVGFFGYQQFDDVRQEARENAKKEVQRYIDEQTVLKDAREELDRQYGEALVRTLRVAPSDDEEFALSGPQMDRLLKVLLSPDTSATIFDETAELLAQVIDTEASWFPRFQQELLRNGVFNSEYVEVFPSRRESVLTLLSNIGTRGASKQMREVLKEEHLSSEAAHAVIDFERHLRMEEPVEEKLLYQFMERSAAPELVSSARALAMAGYPKAEKPRQWIRTLDKVAKEEREVHFMTARKLIADGLAASRSDRAVNKVSTVFRDEVRTIALNLFSECLRVELETGVLGDLISFSPAPSVTADCYVRETQEDVKAGALVMSAIALSQLVSEDLRRASERGAVAFAASIDAWRARAAPGYAVSLSWFSGRSDAKLKLAGQPVAVAGLPLRPNKSYTLDTVPDPKNPQQQLPALRDPSGPVVFDEIDGGVFIVRVMKLAGKDDKE